MPESIQQLPLGLTLETVDRAMSNEVRLLKTWLVTKRPKLLVSEQGTLVSKVRREGELEYDKVKAIVMSGVNIVSMVAKMNEAAKNGNGKMYASKKIQLQKGSYPSESALLLGVIQTILNADEIYTPHGQCLVVTPRDFVDSDDFFIYLVFERPAKVLKQPLDLNKKSEIQVELTLCEALARLKPSKEEEFKERPLGLIIRDKLM